MITITAILRARKGAEQTLRQALLDVAAHVASNEPDNGLGDGDVPGDIQGFVVGTPDTSGQLRAERAGGGGGRVYTLTYQVVDVAGNTGTCSATVTVPLGR